jgi:PKD domain containing protein
VGNNTAIGYTDFAGHPAPTQYNEFLPGFANGEYTASKQATWTVEGNDDYLIYGGEFVAVNGIPQQGLVRFSLKGDKKGDKKEDKNEGKKPEEEKGKNDDKNDWGDSEDDWNDEEDQHGWDERNGDHDGWNNNQHGWW